MDLTHLHLILNHLPVVGIIVGFFVLTWGVVRSYDNVQDVGLSILFFTAMIALPVYLTGEPAEEMVEHLPGVSEQIIELHEESAVLSLSLAIATGALAFLTLVAKRFLSARFGLMAIYFCLLVSIIAGASITYTANLGGQIRHSEIRASQAGDRNVPAQRREAKVDDDD